MIGTAQAFFIVLAALLFLSGAALTLMARRRRPRSAESLARAFAAEVVRLRDQLAEERALRRSLEDNVALHRELHARHVELIERLSPGLLAPTPSRPPRPKEVSPSP